MSTITNSGGSMRKINEAEIRAFVASGEIDEAIGYALEQVEEVTAYVNGGGNHLFTDAEIRAGAGHFLLAPAGPSEGVEWDESSARQYERDTARWIETARRLAGVEVEAPAAGGVLVELGETLDELAAGLDELAAETVVDDGPELVLDDVQEPGLDLAPEVDAGPELGIELANPEE